MTDDIINAGLHSDVEVYGRQYFQAIQFFDQNNRPIDTFRASFVGMMDTITFSQSAGVRRLVLNVEGPFVRRRSPRVEYFSDADQKRRLSTDRGLEFISGLVRKSVQWPKPE
jgi:hypothetical protein